LKDSQYFFFPLLSYRKALRAPSFTLAELFVEVLNPRLGPYFTHFQVYGLNAIFQQTIRALAPPFLRRSSVLEGIEKRFFLFQGFLHSEHSATLEFTLESSEEAKDRVMIRGRPNPDSLRVARRAQRLLRKALVGFGVIPPGYLKMVPPGRSFHVGGSFPMGGADSACRSDRLGRPAGLKRVHILDAATFPSIPATTITFSIMANADRVISETLGG
jgi:choline dehydrogenase-like flavoprotein